MFELQRLRPEHEDMVLEFEIANRTYFAASISDRGDDYFANFSNEHRTLLADQANGGFAFHLLVDERGAVVGRFNLFDVIDRNAVVGYRVAAHVAGQGVATSGLRELCRLARDDYGLATLRAVTSNENVASQRVLEKAGFVMEGPAEVAGRPGVAYLLELASL